ncbi:hypothetical protein [Botrimarina sp.]|uniref:hypothetical protein n=1 Tax=Botrimarina sp. TaxID=2795802 RepID=UPI0032EAAA1C
MRTLGLIRAAALTAVVGLTFAGCEEGAFNNQTDEAPQTSPDTNEPATTPDSPPAGGTTGETNGDTAIDDPAVEEVE